MRILAIDPSTEEWREVPGLFGLYEASTSGRVRRSASSVKVGNATPGRVLSASLSGEYLKVTISVRGSERTVSVHALVAAAFHGERPPGSQVNHKDGNKTNNAPMNLEWSTPSENTRHAVATGLTPLGAESGPALHPESYRGERNGAARLSAEQVDEIRRRRALGESERGLARAFGVHRNTIGNLVARRSW